MTRKGSFIINRGSSIRLIILISLLMFVQASPAFSEELSVNYLLNSKYLIPGMGDSNEGEWVLFKNGKFRRDDPNNPLEAEIITTVVGYLSNKTKIGAVVYGFNTGGTGFFTFLCAVRMIKGKLKTSEVVSLEDRARINSLAIKPGKIVLNWVAHRGTDPAPIPTWQKVTEYKLVGNALIEVLPKTK
jgi:hypothetical protein